MRYDGEIDLIDEDTLNTLLKCSEKPSSAQTSVNPPYRIPHYFMNSRYVINSKTYSDNGYWTKTKFDSSYIFTMDNVGNNRLLDATQKAGIRPVITIKKKLLTRESPMININNIIKKGKSIKYEHETILYGDLVYKQLQGFTVTRDKLIFASSNNNNREKSVLYSYFTSNFKNIFKKEYTTIGHANAMTYNSKTNKVLIAGPEEYRKLYEMNGVTLEKEKEYEAGTYPKFNGIGYHSDADFYIGFTGRQYYLCDTVEMKKLYVWDMIMFETAQDVEYHNGYLFFAAYDGGAPTKYQSYSFNPKGSNVIYVFDLNLDENKFPTRNFGRLICKFYMDGEGELEDVSFGQESIYLGFASLKVDPDHAYTFYQINYKDFVEYIMTQIKEDRSSYYIS